MAKLPRRQLSHLSSDRPSSCSILQPYANAVPELCQQPDPAPERTAGGAQHQATRMARTGARSGLRCSLDRQRPVSVLGLGGRGYLALLKWVIRCQAFPIAERGRPFCRVLAILDPRLVSH